MRIQYVINKGDPEFADGPPDAFEGSMKLTLFGGLSAGVLSGDLNYSYRVTMKEEVPGGSRIMRYTWWNTTDTPHPIKDADDEWTYEMKKIYDGKTVDQEVVDEIKAIWGDTLAIGVPKESPISTLAGLFSTDYFVLPM